MIVYLGFERSTEHVTEVVDCGVGAGQISCYECGGDGDWSKYHPETHTLDDQQKKCVVCKGTGKVYTSI